MSKSRCWFCGNEISSSEIPFYDATRKKDMHTKCRNLLAQIEDNTKNIQAMLDKYGKKEKKNGVE